jgi:hypothetical protein
MISLTGKVDEQEILNDYFECNACEKEPEKGERKIADDFIIVLDEFLDEKDKDNHLFMTSESLFRISFLQFAIS